MIKIKFEVRDKQQEFHIMSTYNVYTQSLSVYSTVRFVTESQVSSQKLLHEENRAL